MPLPLKGSAVTRIAKKVQETCMNQITSREGDVATIQMMTSTQERRLVSILTTVTRHRGGHDTTPVTMTTMKHHISQGVERSPTERTHVMRHNESTSMIPTVRGCEIEDGMIPKTMPTMTCEAIQKDDMILTRSKAILEKDTIPMTTTSVEASPDGDMTQIMTRHIKPTARRCRQDTRQGYSRPETFVRQKRKYSGADTRKRKKW
jgi:hypothetical protein